MVISDCLNLIGTFKNPEGIEAKFHGSGDPFAKNNPCIFELSNIMLL